MNIIQWLQAIFRKYFKKSGMLSNLDPEKIKQKIIKLNIASKIKNEAADWQEVQNLYAVTQVGATPITMGGTNIATSESVTFYPSTGIILKMFINSVGEMKMYPARIFERQL